MTISLISWNVNGIRAAEKSVLGLLESEKPDVMAFQEIKAGEESIPERLKGLGYSMYVNSAARKGYSGTMIMTRIKPVSYSTEFEDDEGRVQRVEFDDYYFVNVYFPNSRRDLSRLEFKLKFDRDLERYVERLEAKKPVLVCGDFNVAHEDIDIARPAENRGNAGFTDEEREWMTEFLGRGRLDTFRMFNKSPGYYTWWAYFSRARDRNIGWRIDYFVASKQMRSRIVKAGILSDIRGSDHAPVYVTLKD